MEIQIQNEYAPPETPLHFPRIDELYFLSKENKDGRFTEYYSVWLDKFKADAIKSTGHEKDGLVRGGMVALHMMQNVPVQIEPQDRFAAFALVPRTNEGTWENSRMLHTLPSCSGNYIHIALDYETLLDRGIKGLLADIGEKQKSHADSAFHKSAKLSLEAVLVYADRYREEAARLLSEETDPARRFELERIRDALAKVPYEPAGSFFEALQSLFIFHFAMNSIESHGISIGRLDYLLDRFYREDLAAGRIIPEEVSEWVQLLMFRANVMNGQADSIVLAGSTPDGGPFWNDLTYFVLDGIRALRQRGPQIWFRYADGVPRSLLARSFVCLREGTAQPGFFYDGVAVPALVRAGFSKEHALDYVSCQCVEISSAGRSQNLCAHSYYNLAKPVEVLLNGGKPIVEADNNFLNDANWNGKNFPADIPVDYETFEDLLDAYEKYLRYLLRASIKHSDDILAYRPEIIMTLSSALIQGCIESGKSLLEGGALYNQTFPNFTSLVTAADSLAAIRKCVYEDKKLTLGELAGLCRDNFRENEGMRQYLLNRCPKYGNDDPEVDGLAKFIYDIIADEIAKHKNIFGAAYAPQYFGFHAPSTHAYTTAATPDGRLHGEATAGTLGGDMGRERKGLTALFCSATSFDHTLSSGGLNVNARLLPTILETEEDIDKIVDLLVAYFHKGGMEVQINCISKEILLDAQKHPENYRDLCVRISGQSAYFNDLSRTFQEQIIKRVEHVG